MKKQIIRLTESDLHNIIKESVKSILSENYGIEDEYNDYDDDNDDTINEDALYDWHIYIYEDEYHSDIKFNSEEEAIADCDKKLEELNFYQLAKENDNDGDENVVALINVYFSDPISDIDDYDDESDTVLVNSGFGWYD